MNHQNFMWGIFKSSISWAFGFTLLLLIFWWIPSIFLAIFTDIGNGIIFFVYSKKIFLIFGGIFLITFSLEYWELKNLQKLKIKKKKEQLLEDLEQNRIFTTKKQLEYKRKLKEDLMRNESSISYGDFLKISEEIQKAKQRREKKEKLRKENFAKSQREKGLELFEGKWVDKKEIPKLKEIQIGLDKNFQNLSPYEFEKFIAKLFKAMGYETRVTRASNDYGIDVVAEKGNEKIAIQCKRYRPGNPVSNRDVQRLLGAMQLKNVQATHSILITTSHFTVQAREQAKECAIELWERRDLEKMVRKYLMKI